MRKRGTGLDSPEANFIYGGPDNEQVYQVPEGSLVPYDRGTAAVDHLIDTEPRVPAGQILAERDKRVAQIDQAIPNAKDIEADRRRVSNELNELSDSGGS